MTHRSKSKKAETLTQDFPMISYPLRITMKRPDLGQQGPLWPSPRTPPWAHSSPGPLCAHFPGPSQCLDPGCTFLSPHLALPLPLPVIPSPAKPRTNVGNLPGNPVHFVLVHFDGNTTLWENYCTGSSISPSMLASLERKPHDLLFF